MATGSGRDLRILSFDIGGTHLKASIVDGKGQLVAEKVRMETPYPCPPAVMMDALFELARPLPEHNRIAVGFPGVVRNNRVLTAPHFGTGQWANFPLAEKLAKKLGGPARLINDAEMQGLAVITGKGLELVLTLGTGAGTGLFRDGEIMPHMELAHHPVHGDKTYNDYVGDGARKKAGRKQWNKRIAKVIGILHTLLNYDRLYIGGGNSRRVDIALPRNVTLVSNEAGIEGAAALWRLPDKIG